MTTLETPSVTRSYVPGFPFPFVDDHYRYSTNVEPADHSVTTAGGQWGDSVVVVDDDYRHELDERASILEADPSRYAVLPHMQPAAWDAMLTLMRELAAAYPAAMRLTALDDDRWRWENDLLGERLEFRYGDVTTLPAEPLRYIGTQVQEDIALLDQRAGELFVDGGLISFAADWSFGFDVGMSFLEIHGPVPRVRKEGVITRAHEFIKRLQPHAPYRRTNWTMTIGRRLDVSTERYPDWGPDREMIQHVDDETFGRLVHLRVEVQHLIRLPESGAIMFLIRTYMLPFEQLAGVDAWRTRTAEVLAELPDDMADYKGIIKYRTRAAQWLTDHAALNDHLGLDEHAPQTAVAEVEAERNGMPVWPSTPPAVDVDARAFLIIAIGGDPQTAHVSRTWVGTAETVGPTRLLVLDALDVDHDRAALEQALGETSVGSRIMVVGSQFDVLAALSMARAQGAIASELAAFVTSTADLGVYCAHCANTSRVTAAVGDVITCPGCARSIEIHEHHSASRGSFLASASDARELS